MINNKRNDAVFRALDFIRDHIILVIALAIVVTVVVAAGIMTNHKDNKNNSNKEANGVVPQTEYVDMNTVYLPMSKIKSFNPIASDDSDTYYIAQLLYSGLFTLDDNLNVKKELVESYKTYKISGTVEMTLRDDAKFSNGNVVTEADVAATVKNIKSAGKKSPYYNYVSKIEKVSGYNRKVTIKFKDRYDAALDNLVFPIIPASGYSKDKMCIPAGSGMYKIEKISEDRMNVKLEPNKNYYGNLPKNKIQFRKIKDLESIPGMITMDSITAYVNTTIDAKQTAEDRDLKATPVRSSEMECLGFNFKNKNLKNRSVRQAICMALDNENILSECYGEDYITSDSIYYPGFLGVKDGEDPYTYNQSKAIEMLSAQGYKDKFSDGVLKDKKGKRFKLNLLVSDVSNRRCDAASMIQNQLENIGIKITINEVSQDEFEKTLKSGDFDIAFMGYRFDKSYNLKKLVDKKNTMSYNDIVVANGANDLEQVLTASEQKRVFKDLKSDLNKDVPYYCVGYRQYMFVSVKKFHKPFKPVFFDPYRGVDQWKWKRTVLKDRNRSNSDSDKDN